MLTEEILIGNALVHLPSTMKAKTNNIDILATAMPWNIGVLLVQAPLVTINTGFKLMYKQVPC